MKMKLLTIAIIAATAMMLKAGLAEPFSGQNPDSDPPITAAPYQPSGESGESGNQTTDSTTDNSSANAIASASAQATATTISEKVTTNSGSTAQVYVRPQTETKVVHEKTVDKYVTLPTREKVVYLKTGGTTKVIYRGYSGVKLQAAIRKSLIGYVPEKRLNNMLGRVWGKVNNLDTRLSKIEAAMPKLEKYRHGETVPQKDQWRAISTAQATANQALGVATKTANQVNKPDDGITALFGQEAPGGPMLYLFMTFVLLFVLFLIFIFNKNNDSKNTSPSSIATAITSDVEEDDTDEIAEESQIKANREAFGFKDAGNSKGFAVYGKGGKFHSGWESWDNSSNLTETAPKPAKVKAPVSRKKTTKKKTAPAKVAGATTPATTS